MDSSNRQYGNFNPDGVGMKNGNFIGLPFTESSAKIVLLPVPWDVTVSYGAGTVEAPQAILNASVQLDLYDADVENGWMQGIFMRAVDQHLAEESRRVREKSSIYIEFLEEGGVTSERPDMVELLSEINSACSEMIDRVFEESSALLQKEKIVGVIGGDHSVPLGYIRALSKIYNSFGVLQIDAHSDLREDYQGFKYSHASIFYNVLKEKSVTKLVQVGIRDYCDEEADRVKDEGGRVAVYSDQAISENHFKGMLWIEQCREIIEQLPSNVYVSFDVDGMDPKLCPNTGTPVPGGLSFQEVLFLLKLLVESDRKIIGFDVCETGNSEWDANVASRIIYKLCNLTGRSHKLI